MKKILSLLLISILFISFSGCGDDDEARASMTLKIDGVDVKIVTVTGILLFQEESGHEARGLNLTGVTRNNDYLTVQITNWDFQNPPTNGFIKKKYYNVFDTEGGGLETAECLEVEGDVSLCDAAMVTFIDETNGEIYTSAFDEDLAGFVEVTSSNGKKISGKFDVIVTGFDNETDLHATGTFKNVPYMISH